MQRAHRLPALASLALAALAAGAHAQSVWIVDAAGGGDFTDLPPAAAAAQDGDVLLVKSGNYSRLVLTDKGLSILAEPGEQVVVAGLVVGQLWQSQSFLARGLDLACPSGGPDLNCVQLYYNVGPVWLEDCIVRFASEGVPGQNRLALRIDMCDSVTLVDCAVFGRADTAPQPTTWHPAAMSGIVSRITGQRTTFVGSKGSPATLVDGVTVAAPSAGSPGVILEGCSLFLYDSTIDGGEGGDGAFLLGACVDGASGGAGLALWNQWSQSHAYVAASGIQGGAPGAPAVGCGTGSVGPQLDVQKGWVADVPVDGAPRVLTAPVAVREGQSLDLVFSGGAPGELVLLGLSYGSGQTFMPQFEGAVVLAATIQVIDVGVMPASGPLVASFPVGTLLPGTMGLPLYLQSCHVGLEPNLGTGVGVVVLDSTL